MVAEGQEEVEVKVKEERLGSSVTQILAGLIAPAFLTNGCCVHFEKRRSGGSRHRGPFEVSRVLSVTNLMRLLRGRGQHTSAGPPSQCVGVFAKTTSSLEENGSAAGRTLLV